jgi:surface polysaccharide O-acyltransferase-like enzyme
MKIFARSDNTFLHMKMRERVCVIYRFWEVKYYILYVLCGRAFLPPPTFEVD